MVTGITLIWLAVMALGGYGMYRLVRMGLMQSKWTRALGIFFIGCAVSTLNLGPIGLILGMPSIVITSILASLIFDVKEKA